MTYDLAVIGGGINGCGIARDAAGRGLRVVLVELDDLASATSQWSTKLIHGGLRYLEHYEFKLVRESLQEREVLLKLAPHLIEPMSFVLPHEPHMRPAWMLRVGLFMYDKLGGKQSVPSSFGVSLPDARWGAGLQPRFSRAFVYSDAQVDDARLTLANALAAHEDGASIRTRTKLVRAQRDGGLWNLTVKSRAGEETLHAKAVVNAAGPWVKEVLDHAFGFATPESVKLVKGSHIVVPRVHDESHAILMQNADGRVVFVIPWQGSYSLIGTTDVPVADVNQRPEISDDETRYLLDVANKFLTRKLSTQDIVFRYAGVRPLFDDGNANASAVTRDYVLKLQDENGALPLLSVFGGKLTTYRYLSQEVMGKLSAYMATSLPTSSQAMRADWTHDAPLPGGDLHEFDTCEAYAQSLQPQHSGIPPDYLARLVRRHGDRTANVLRGAKSVADLGEIFGLGREMLTEREIDYCIAHEWAMHADDILWRRTKCGLHMNDAERARAAAFIDKKLKHAD
jgi:glycerol-3-phosphate dehydrogenase